MYLQIKPILTRLCHVIYCHGDRSYPCLVGIGLRDLQRDLEERIFIHIKLNFWMEETAVADNYVQDFLF